MSEETPQKPDNLSRSIFTHFPYISTGRIAITAAILYEATKHVHWSVAVILVLAMVALEIALTSIKAVAGKIDELIFIQRELAGAMYMQQMAAAASRQRREKEAQQFYAPPPSDKIVN